MVRHHRWPLARRGTRPPRQRLPQAAAWSECDCEHDGLRDAPRRGPELRRFCRRTARGTHDTREQQGGPHPECPWEVLGIP